MKLSEILKEQNDIIEKIIENEGAVTPEIEAALATIDLKLPEKVDGYCHIMDRIANEALYLSGKADDFYKAAKTLKDTYERIKDQIKFNMERAGVKSLGGHDYRFSLKGTKGSVEVTNEALIPEEFIKTELVKKIDKNLIYSVIKAGNTVPGAHVVEGSSLQRDVKKGD